VRDKGRLAASLTAGAPGSAYWPLAANALMAGVSIVLVCLTVAAVERTLPSDASLSAIEAAVLTGDPN